MAAAGALEGDRGFCSGFRVGVGVGFPKEDVWEDFCFLLELEEPILFLKIERRTLKTRAAAAVVAVAVVAVVVAVVAVGVALGEED